MYIRYCNGILCTAQDAIKDQKSINGHNTAVKSKQLHLYLITKDASSEKKINNCVYLWHQMQALEKGINTQDAGGGKVNNCT